MAVRCRVAALRRRILPAYSDRVGPGVAAITFFVGALPTLRGTAVSDPEAVAPG
jgi:hypothetical protein